MAIVFTPARLPGDIQKGGGSLLYLVGTFTFSGSYATGGEALDLSKTFKRIGLGLVLGIPTPLRGHHAEYDSTNNKVKLYSSANTEHAAAAYNAALTGSPVPVIIIGR
jgi:hypothetical protein